MPTPIAIVPTPIPTPEVSPFSHIGIPSYSVKSDDGEYRVNLNYFRDGMHVYVTANILGGRSSNPEMHCGRTEIMWGAELVVTESGDCLKYEDGQKFRRNYGFDYLFMESGNAEIVFTYNSLVTGSIWVHVDENSSSAGILTPTKALEELDGTHVHVSGMYYKGEDSEAGLCSFVFDSYPPSCFPELTLENFPEQLQEYANTENGITWIEESVTLAGTISDGVLTVVD